MVYLLSIVLDFFLYLYLHCFAFSGSVLSEAQKSDRVLFHDPECFWGVKYFAMVNFNPDPSSGSIMVCTDPFPKERTPPITPRP